MARAKFDDWLTEDALLRIESWASDGLTNEDISQNMGIHPSTLSNWLKRYDQLNQALKKGREPVVREIENALIKKAKGFEYEETTTEMWVDDDGNKRQQVRRHKRYSPPDTSAAIFLLKNYKPNKYRNYNDLTKKQIETEMRKVEAEIDKINFEIRIDTDQNDKIIDLVSKLDEVLNLE